MAVTCINTELRANKEELKHIKDMDTIQNIYIHLEKQNIR